MSGFPACADPQIHCFYLFAMPLFALLGDLKPVWFDRVALLHILAAGIGIYFLARQFKMTPFAAVATAIIVMFGGSASARLQHTGMIYAYGLLPWCMLLTKVVCERSSPWYVLALGVCAGSMGVLGDQVAFLNCLTVAAFALALVVTAFLKKADVKATCWRLLASGVLTLLVMAPQIIPTLELLPLSSRPWIPLENLRPKSLYSWSFLTYLIPDIFRTFDGYANYIGKNDPTETYLYIGILPATIFLYGGILKGLLFKKKTLWFVLPLLFFVLYALGTQTPVYALFWHVIPGVKSFQRPTDATFPLNVFLALLIGWMLDRLRYNRPSTFAGFVAPLLTTAIVLLVTILLCRYKVPHVVMHDNIFAFWKLGILVLIGSALLQALVRSKQRGTQNILIAVIAFISFADLHIANSSTFLNAAAASEYSYDDPANLMNVPGLRALSQLKSPAQDPFRVEMLGSETEREWWNAANHLKVQSTDGMWPINLLSYHQYAGACNPIFGRRFNHWMAGFDSPLFDLLNVKYVLTNYPATKISSILDQRKFKPVSKLEQYTVYENVRVLPRCFLVGRYKMCQSFGELSGVMRSVSFVPAQEVVLLADDLTGEGSKNSLESLKALKDDVSASDTVNLLNYGQNEIDISARCQSDRLLFLGDIYYPGWTAYIDGVETKISRADYLFRAILVKKGDHKIQFKYWPYSMDAIRESARLAKTS